MSDGEAWLGVDLGTQGVRAILVDADGAVLGTGRAPLTSRRTGTRHEQDPREWWTATCLATRQALDGFGGRPAAMSACSTSGTLVVEGADGAAVGPGLMYDDARGREQTGRVVEAGAALWDRLGHRPQPTWAITRLAQLAEAGELGTGRRIAHQADHLGRRLTGHRVATDVSHALKSGYDQIALRWPDDVLARVGVDPSVLPDVVLAGEVVGEVCATAAEASGIPVGTPVRAGMTDGCAALISAAALRPGDWCSSMGTTLVLKGSTTRLLRDPSGAVYSHRHPDGGWLPGGASSTGAGLLVTAFPGADLDALTARAARQGLPSLVTYPLAGRGERFPFVAPDATAFGLGAADFASAADPEAARFSAILHGVSYLERLALDVVAGLGAETAGRMALTGGASRNRWWNQLRADVLEREVVVPAHPGAGFGSAVLAAAAAGELAATAGRMVTVRERLAPDPGRGAMLAEHRQQLVQALAERGWYGTATVSV